VQREATRHTARVSSEGAGRAVEGRRRNSMVVVAAAALAAALAAHLAHSFGMRMAALLLIGLLLGMTLYLCAFGFSSSWRALVTRGDGTALRAQMLMLAVATLLFFPALAEGGLFGAPVAGAVAPIGVSLLVGAFLFGVGMQLGGGCGSGTLYTVGGGNLRMLVTLAFFVAGSVLATAHVPWWFRQPDLGSVALLERLGLGAALAVQLALIGALAALTVLLRARSRHGAHDGASSPAPGARARRWSARIPWPLAAGAVLLAVLNWATLAVAGHPWGVTYGFTLWGAKLATLAGLDLGQWEFWTWSYHRQALAGSVLANTTSVMNVGILIGALLAAGIAGRFAPSFSIPLRSLLAAALGGLLMGYGARLAYGCNIGAFFGGVASGSLHGWAWFVVALLGTALGARLRPRFGLGA